MTNEPHIPAVPRSSGGEAVSTDHAPGQPAWGPGSNTGHGHVWERPDGLKVRCGGPGLCQVCSASAAALVRPVGAPRPVESDALPIVAFAHELATELSEIQGQELYLDGKEYLVTTQAQILEWIGWHLHCPVEGEDAQDRPIVTCLCGWTAGPFDTFTNFWHAASKHREEGIAALRDAQSVSSRKGDV